MYKQERKAGVVQFLICAAAGILLWVVCDIIGLLIKNSLAADIIFIAGACILVYCVYVHYCSVFTYELEKKKLIIERKIGHREVKEEITLSKINGIYEKKPEANIPKDIKSFTVSVISKGKYCYIVYDKNRKCLIFEPDKKLLELLKENING